jgi:hypothetical protein
MGMIFGPLFEVITGGLQPHEMGSGSSVLQSVNGLGMSLGVAGLGTLFFGLVGRPGAAAMRQAVFVQAAELTLLISVGLLAVAFAICFLLPTRDHERAQLPSDAAIERAAA